MFKCFVIIRQEVSERNRMQAAGSMMLHVILLCQEVSNGFPPHIPSPGGPILISVDFGWGVCVLGRRGGKWFPVKWGNGKQLHCFSFSDRCLQPLSTVFTVLHLSSFYL